MLIDRITVNRCGLIGRLWEGEEESFIMKKLIVNILLIAFVTLRLTYALYENYTMYSIMGKNLTHEKLANILSENIKLIEEPGVHKQGLIIAGPNHTAKLVKFFHNYRINYTVVTSNLHQYLKQQKSEDLSFRSANTLEHYLTYKEIQELLQEWSMFPGVTTRSIGQSVEKREIPVLQINVSPKKPAVVLECGIHAREWISHAACMNFAYTMIKNPCESIRKVSLYIVPVLNPDGYVVTHTTDRINRKNCGRPHPVDLNRNFDAGWKPKSHGGSPLYPGPKAFSEPESRAMKKLVESLGDQLIFYLGLHSYGQKAMYPYGYTRKNAKTLEMHDQIADKAVEILKCEPKTGCNRYRDSVYEYESGAISKVMYLAYGSSVDWVYDSSKSGRKAAFAIELPPKGFIGTAGFLTSPKFINPVNRSFVPTVCGMIEERLKFSDKYFI
ncbi:zinc carboxypeptidase-like [Brevipalpus obovatus]|uniref:zinc carboxypeptidase-like n=1 Tax=Brevipalpus obovatus TaxID=246614 RepID=UPI003D9F3D5C